MANLIITVISIALVAVGALMGAYYGGQAFLDGQTKVRGQRLISDAEQIAGAMRLWSANNGGSQVLWPLAGGAYCQIISTTPIVAQNYVSQLPYQDWQFGIGGANQWSFVNPSVSDATCKNGTASVLIAGINTTSLPSIAKVCTYINDTLGIGTGTYVSNSWDWATGLGSNPYACLKASSTGYYFVYRVF